MAIFTFKNAGRAFLWGVLAPTIISGALHSWTGGAYTKVVEKAKASDNWLYWGLGKVDDLYAHGFPWLIGLSRDSTPDSAPTFGATLDDVIASTLNKLGDDTVDQSDEGTSSYEARVLNPLNNADRILVRETMEGGERELQYQNPFDDLDVDLYTEKQLRGYVSNNRGTRGVTIERLDAFLSGIQRVPLEEREVTLTDLGINPRDYEGAAEKVTFMRLVSGEKQVWLPNLFGGNIPGNPPWVIESDLAKYAGESNSTDDKTKYEKAIAPYRQAMHSFLHN